MNKNSNNNSTDQSVTDYFYSFKYFRGSVKRVQFSKHVNAMHFLTPQQTPSMQCIVDSGATHHMWNDPHAFVSFIPETEGGYVKLVNNAKIPIVGSGTIRINFNDYIIEIDDVFYVPSLINSLYSKKQHIRNPSCAFHCAFEYSC